MVNLSLLVNSITVYDTTLFILTGKKNPMRAPVTFPTNVMAPITPELKPVINQVIILHFMNFKPFIF